MPKPAVETSGVLRAKAGALRDSEASAPDWPVIEGLLVQSYSDLHQALNPPRTR